jgi:hypothetical protein
MSVRLSHWAGALLGLATLVNVSLAQRPPREGAGPDDRPPPRPGRPGAGVEEGPPPPPPPFGPPPSPVIAALDTDADGSLSADEIKNAARALLTLDHNQDGVLDESELRPPPPPGGPGGPGGDPRAFVDFVFQFDKDEDGKVTKAELPERMQRLMQTADRNGDGALSRAEMEALARQRSARQGPGGPGGRGFGPPGGGPGGPGGRGFGPPPGGGPGGRGPGGPPPGGRGFGPPPGGPEPGDQG